MCIERDIVDTKLKFVAIRGWVILSTKKEEFHWGHTSSFCFVSQCINVIYWSGNSFRCHPILTDTKPPGSADLHEPERRRQSDSYWSMQDLWLLYHIKSSAHVCIGLWQLLICIQNVLVDFVSHAIQFIFALVLPRLGICTEFFPKYWVEREK